MNQHEYAAYVDENALLRGLADRPDPITDAGLFPLVERLCDFYRDLKAEQSRQPAIYQPGGEWAAYLDSQRHIYQPLLDRNVPAATTLLRSFWRNELGPVVKQYATFEKLQGDAEARARFTDLMAHDYMTWANLLHAPGQELTIPEVGNPWGYFIDDVLIAPKALRYHALATQIRLVTADVKRPVIAEIGAGYGGTAYFLLRGRNPVTYLDFDLPEVLVLAAYYLMRTLPHRKILMYEPGMKLTRAVLQRYHALLMPNWLLPRLPANSVELFLNTFSLSEMPWKVIREYIRQIERCCRGYFLYNNMDRGGVFNRGHERTPCSQYPISPRKLKTVYKRYDLFQQLHSGRDGDYREVLLQRIG